jgi:hypothetical protein
VDFSGTPSREIIEGCEKKPVAARMDAQDHLHRRAGAMRDLLNGEYIDAALDIERNRAIKNTRASFRHLFSPRDHDVGPDVNRQRGRLL